MFDKTDRHHHGFSSGHPERTDVPLAWNSEPAALVLVAVGLAGLAGALDLTRD
jgi:hypothetical protein